MQVQVKASSDDVAVQVEGLVQFYLAGVSGHVDSFAVAVQMEHDPFGATLYRCRVRAMPARGDTVDIEEIQGDMVLAVTRALDRCVRTFRRRLKLRRLPRSA